MSDRNLYVTSRANASQEEDEYVTEEEVEQEFSEEAIAEVLKEIPNSESRMEIVLNKKADALYNLGIAYRNDIQDFVKSDITFNRIFFLLMPNQPFFKPHKDSRHQIQEVLR